MDTTERAMDYARATVEEESRAMAALGANFQDAFILDLNTKELRGIRFAADTVADNPADIEAFSYEASRDSYVAHNVFQEDQERVRDALSPEGIRRRLGDKQSFVERFRVERVGGEFSGYYMKVARIDDAGNRDRVVIAFAPENTFSYASGYAPEPAHTRVEGRAGKRQVLVVEDSEINREMLTAILEDEYDVLTAEDGKVGLELLSQHHRTLSAVLLDVYMPVCNGFEFMRISQADEDLARVPVIVTTGSSSAEEEVKCLSLGASDFVPKPYNPQVVLGRLKSIIRLRESIKALEAVEFDPLTGALSRPSFMLRAGEKLDACHDKTFHMVAVSVDNLRSLSALAGRVETNKVVFWLGQRLVKEFSSTMVGRVETDCFVLLSDRSVVDKEATMHRLHAMVEDIPAQGAIVKFGVYEYVDTSLSLQALIDRCQIAADAARYNGFINIAYFDEAASQKMIADQAIEAAFPQALADGEFVPWFQPKYGTKDTVLRGAEVLVRWMKADGTMVSPGAFIPVLERTGLIADLDEYMFTRVCAFQRERLDKGLLLVPISVNLSRASLLNSCVVQTFAGIAQKYGVPFEFLPIELTESMSVADNRVTGALEGLAEAGFSLHLDDFGSGYSSLSSLCELPLKVLKLDKSLVDRIGTFEGNMLVKTSIVLANRFGLKVVAEGVETQEQVDFLRHTTCEQIQGFIYSAPKPQAAFEELLASPQA